MRSRWVVSTIVAVAAAVATAPVASAAPQCVNLTPTTTQCHTPGHSQITTSPPAMNDDTWWPYGTVVFGYPW